MGGFALPITGLGLSSVGSGFQRDLVQLQLRGQLRGLGPMKKRVEGLYFLDRRRSRNLKITGSPK